MVSTGRVKGKQKDGSEGARVSKVVTSGGKRKGVEHAKGGKGGADAGGSDQGAMTQMTPLKVRSAKECFGHICVHVSKWSLLMVCFFLCIILE